MINVEVYFIFQVKHEFTPPPLFDKEGPVPTWKYGTVRTFLGFDLVWPILDGQ